MDATLDADALRWVDETLASLTLREKVGQLVNMWIPGAYVSTASADFDTLRHWIVDEGIGGVSISIGQPHTYAAKLNDLQRLARVPLLVTADFESGGPGMRLSNAYAVPHLMYLGGGTAFPPTMAFGAIGEERFAYELGRITGLEARAVGVHMTFAPVMDVNSNPENPIINTRSFGEDPELVARMGAAFIRGAQSAGLLTTAKHFPGHGDTRSDSHIDLPSIDATRERLDTLELVPFVRAIDAGVDAIMTAHIAAPAILGPLAPPATLSDYFLRDLLRDELGFRGVVFTDAIRMGAISGRHGVGESGVLALEAGSDVILSPRDVTAAIEAAVAAVGEGRLSEARIDESVRRILTLKARAGLHRGRLVDVDAVDDVVGRRSHMAFADTAAQRSITLPRDSAGLVPLKAGRRGLDTLIGDTATATDDPAADTTLALSGDSVAATDAATGRAVSDDATVGPHFLSIVFARPENPVAGLAFHRALRAAADSLETARVNELTHYAVYDSLAARADSADLVLVSVFVAPSAGRGTVGVPETFADFVNRIVDSAKPTVVLSFGNPYLLDAFPGVGTYLIAWGGGEVSQRAAARALLGEAPIEGTLPISLPPYHRRGEGLRRPAEMAAAAVGMSPGRLARVDSIILAAIADSAAPGAALAVGRHGRLVRLRGYGRLDWGTDGHAVSDSSIYDLASLTKVVGTTTAVMLLSEEGRVELDAPVSTYLPWWTGGGKQAVTVRQLLLHRGGLPPFLPLWRELSGREAYQRALAGIELVYEPGDSTVYSDLGLITLGFVVEAVSGMPLDEFLQTWVFDPLGMHDTGFVPDTSLLQRIAPTEVDTVFRFTHVHGMVHDENAYALGGIAGHAGLFSSARDLAVFAQLLLDGGDVTCPNFARACPAGAEERRLLARETVAAFTSRHDSLSSRALGWDTPGRRSSAGDYMSASAFGHTGFTGTSIWMDPELDLFVVLLTNRVNPTRANQKHIPLRRAVHDAVVQAITDVSVEKRIASGER